MVERTKTLELKKHVATIHSSNKLSLLQRKIANALLYNAYDQLLEKEEFTIHIATLCKLIGYCSNDYKTIKKSLVNLLATVIEWNLVDKDRINAEGVWNASSIIADAGIDGPICTYSYSNKMKKLLYRPELYGRLNMLVQAKFQSSYGLALYENCIRFQGIERTPWFDMENFRKLMGVDEKKYKIFRDFKHRVLEKAMEEVNKYSPITVTPHYRKEGRKVIAIQFAIQQTGAIAQPIKPKAALSDVLKMKFGLSKRQTDEVMCDYDEDYILEKIAVVEASPSYSSGKITNLSKYFMCALKDDYQLNKTSKNVIEMNENKREEGSSLPKLTQESLELYHRYQSKALIDLFMQQPKRKQKAILKTFEEQLGRSIYLDIYRRDGLANILIKDQLCLYIKQFEPDLLKQVMTYEAFIAKKYQREEAIA